MLPTFPSQNRLSPAAAVGSFPTVGVGIRVGLMIALFSVGCAGLPHADATDVAQAQHRFPGTTAGTLETGRELYAQSCSGCHPLHLPSEHGPAEWAALLPEMEDNAKMKPEARVLVEQYLMTMSARSSARAAGPSETVSGTGGSGLPTR